VEHQLTLLKTGQFDKLYSRQNHPARKKQQQKKPRNRWAAVLYRLHHFSKELLGGGG
jgi:hypothetical protein